MNAACDNNKILWFLGFNAFYEQCPEFKHLHDSATKLAEFIKKHDLGNPKRKGCKCHGFSAVRAQKKLVKEFTVVCSTLYNGGGEEKLKPLLRFIQSKESGITSLTVPYFDASNTQKQVVIT